MDAGFTTEARRTRRGSILFVYREIPIDEKNPCNTLNKSLGFHSIIMGRIFLFVGISRQTENLLCALSVSVVKAFLPYLHSGPYSMLFFQFMRSRQSG
jgi:hypothetical protein